MRLHRNFIIVLLTSLSAFGYGQTKKPICTENDFCNWATLKSPIITPNGKHVSYCLENESTGYTSLIIKSVDHRWSKTIEYRSRYNFAFADDKKMIFQISNDSILFVNLGADITYIVGYDNFKASIGSNSVSFQKGDSLLIIEGARKYILTNVKNHNFVPHSNKILLHKYKGTNTSNKQYLILLDTKNKLTDTLWECSTIDKIKYNSALNKVAFLSKDKSPQDTGRLVVIDLISHKTVSFRSDSNQTFLIDDILSFSNGDSSVILNLVEQNIVSSQANDINLKVWSFTDEIVPPLRNETGKSKWLASGSIESGVITRLEQKNDYWGYNGDTEKWGRYCIISQTCGECYYTEQFWNKACIKNWIYIDTNNGNRTPINKLKGRNPINNYSFSSDCNFIVYYDYDSNAYYSYNVKLENEVILTNGKIRDIFNSIPPNSHEYLKPRQRGVAAWGADGESVYIYDQFDIWKFDVRAKNDPVNITNGFGSQNKIVFSFSHNDSNTKINNVWDEFITALNIENKRNGFFKLDKNYGNPKLLTMGNYLYYQPHYNVESNGLKPVKALKSNVYLVRRESSQEHPNFFVTKDFINFENISNFYPETKYQWLSSELHAWKMADGRMIQGILYKPENFDSARKYPVVIDIYEQQSNGLNTYIEPGFLCNGCRVHPLLMVNEGYLVLRPDIFYKLDKTGESALLAVESAVEHLKQFRWVDTSKLGLQGCSFGGFETNYIVTHSKLFTAACASSAMSDILSWASEKYIDIYTSFSYQQYRMKARFWEDISPYIDNSPLFRANNIVTPLLIFHTSADNAVPFNQGVQMFLTLRHLGKPAWLLEYGGDANHGVVDKAQQKDFSTRMIDFFGFYLKDVPISTWMDKSNSK